jgi:AraC family transcriptional regulator
MASSEARRKEYWARINRAVDYIEKNLAEVGKMGLPGGTYAQALFELDPGGYAAAWEAVYGGWLPESGYQPDDRLAFERYLNDPKDHPEGKHIVEICILVKPL